MTSRARRKNVVPLRIAGRQIERGRTYDLHLDYSQSYTGISISVPVRVVAAEKPGPVVFLCATVHGDELNGIGIIRRVLFDRPLKLQRGTVIAVPVVNVLGLESHTRYLPDRRDLNRCFPGSPKGSLSSRLAHLIFDEVVRHCDYALDFHTAAVRRTNYPNIRADLDHPVARRMAHAFGCELIVHSKGAEGSLRREAVERGIPAIVLEAGEVWKIEPGVVEIGARGAVNVLKHLGMLTGRIEKPRHQLEVRKSVWVRAERGGILKFHALPGDLVRAGQCLATNVTIFGEVQNQLEAPADGIVLGMTTMPAVKPGEPVFHIALTTQSHARMKRRISGRSQARLHRKVQAELATSITLSSRS
ncbi:MAG TPA: succinate dehydrogenase [Verrucomicrobiales bacterium]|nr:succinate dehydrogenase [Verrucomicrobiales bacterium]